MNISRTMLAPLTALALTSTLLASTATATPDEQEIADARAAQSATSAEIADLEIELAQVGAQVDEAQLRAQVANEEYLRARDELETAVAGSEQAQEEAAAAQAELELARAALGAVATAAYRGGSGSLSSLEPFLSADGFADAMARSTAVQRLGNQADEQVQRFEALEQVTDTLQRRADAAVAEQQDAAAALSDAAGDAQDAADAAATQLSLSGERREQLVARLAEQRETTVALERERQESLDEERRRRQEAAAAAAAEEAAGRRDGAAASRSNDRTPATTEEAASASTAPPTEQAPPAEPAPSPTTPAPSPEPTSPPAASVPASSVGQRALAWARTQIGKPYGWGAAGPNAYDCSGLTMQAFANAGRSLPRNSRAQYHATTRISAAQLRPGDLIFYSRNGAASGIYHIAFYAGGSTRVHAPAPGRNVEQAPLWGSANIIGYGRVL